MKHGCPGERKLTKLNQVKTRECFFEEVIEDFLWFKIPQNSSVHLFLWSLWNLEGSWICYFVDVQGSTLPQSLHMNWASFPFSKTLLHLPPLGFLSNWNDLKDHFITQVNYPFWRYVSHSSELYNLQFTTALHIWCENTCPSSQAQYTPKCRKIPAWNPSLYETEAETCKLASKVGHLLSTYKQE